MPATELADVNRRARVDPGHMLPEPGVESAAVKLFSGSDVDDFWTVVGMGRHAMLHTTVWTGGKLMRVVNGLTQLEQLTGKKIGTSKWIAVTQEMVNQFATLTRDHQWIHVDTDRARRESPYGGPIVHGFFTLSLLPYFGHQLLTVDGVSRLINYGVNRVRFPNAVRVGARLRGVQTVMSVERTKPDVARMTSTLVIEVEGQKKPACVAETVTLVFA